ncbi:RNA-binding domain-containing protein [Geoglobus acetivorans]|uniref:ATP-binding protein n=1 Tax=Geoglobus acetivorans TaxID=565033 RepID=A0ABZ3H4L1_GEOAI
MDLGFILKLIREGESEKIEFKRSATGDINREICAFANAEGGYILIGVDDDGNIVGCNVKNPLMFSQILFSPSSPRPRSGHAGLHLETGMCLWWRSKNPVLYVL